MANNDLRATLQACRDEAQARIEMCDRAIAALATIDQAKSMLADCEPREPVSWRDKAGDMWIKADNGNLRCVFDGAHVEAARTNIDPTWGDRFERIEDLWGPLTPIYDESEVTPK